MNLGEKLFELRRTKNLTQDDVAEKLNVTRQTVSKWETNQSTPDFDKILPLCELYGISPNELLKGESKETNNNENKEELNWSEAKNHLFTRGEEDEKDYTNMNRNQIKQKSAEVVSSSILIFIVAIAFAGIGTTVMMWNPVIIGCTFLIMVGFGVTRIVKHYMSIPKFEKTKKEAKQDRMVKQINDIIGAIGVSIYFIVSFVTMAWHITWVIFIIMGMIEQIVKLVFMLKEDEDDEE
jgi:transcriptional regulator with XRE-family HTH domain/energy-converting hydrogenase Eha subunit E